MSALRPVANAVLALLVVTLTTAAGSAGVRPGSAEGAELVKTGWWWAANETALDETVVAPPQSSPPNVPKGALPVSAVGGDPEKFSALEFSLDAEEGDFVESGVLVLKENAEPAASANVENAVVLACPVTESFWADGASAAWKARPSYDCDLASAQGERDDKGVWTFDLTAIASLWVAEGHKGSTAVALVEGVEAPMSFQVAFDGPAAEGIGWSFTVGEGGAGGLAPMSPGAVAPSGSGGAGSGSAGATSGGLATGGSPSGSLSPADTGGAPTAGEAEIAASEPAGGDAEAAPAATAATTPVAAPVAAPAWYSGIPVGGLLILPLVLGLAYLLMLALGPEAQPAVGTSQHGVGRALERLRTMGSALATKGGK